MNIPRKIDLDSLLDESGNEVPKGQNVRSVGPSDSSDSGADLIGAGSIDDIDALDDEELDSTSDRNGTGERGSAENEADGLPGADISPDRIVDARHAGLGGGLDQAEEAQLGITDEEIDAATRERLGLDS
jgi:hypothetical protein